VTPVRRSGARAAASADDILSAQVIVRAASGRKLAAGDVIDASTLPQFVAAPADVHTVQSACTTLGFTVGPYVGISFSISGRRSQFEQAFGVKLSVRRDGAVTVVGRRQPMAQQLPLERLDPAVRAQIDTVSFSPPVELHDGGLMS
jgi:hypothetical protein